MSKGFYYALRNSWKKPDIKKLRESMIEWRTQKSVEKIDKPTRLDKARSLGYKAKKGFIIARVRVLRGGRRREKPAKGRRSKRQTNLETLKMSYRWVAEQRSQNKYPNLEVLNSYYLSKDGKNYFFEVILVDPYRREIQNDKTINWICNKNNRGRVYRGLTSAGKKSRGLRRKSPDNKSRPSVHAGMGRGK